MCDDTHEFNSFMMSEGQRMANEYRLMRVRIDRDNTKSQGVHAQTAGNQGEETWAQTLRDWLPPTYQIATRGRVYFEAGSLNPLSPEVDILVLHPTYPRGFSHWKHYFSGGVLAAFECKLKLRPADLSKAIKNSVSIRRHMAERYDTPYRELNSGLIYGLLTFSHKWLRSHNSSEHSPSNVEKQRLEAVSSINEILKQADNDLVEHPREMLDFICVADLGVWIAYKCPWVTRQSLESGIPYGITAGSHVEPQILQGEGLAQTGYMSFAFTSRGQSESFTPLGTFISQLYTKLGWEDPSIRRLGKYLYHSWTTGSGEGWYRNWTSSVYSEQTTRDLVSGKLVSEAQERVPHPFETEAFLWDEWSLRTM